MKKLAEAVIIGAILITGSVSGIDEENETNSEIWNVASGDSEIKRIISERALKKAQYKRAMQKAIAIKDYEAKNIGKKFDDLSKEEQEKFINQAYSSSTWMQLVQEAKKEEEEKVRRQEQEKRRIEEEKTKRAQAGNPFYIRKQLQAQRNAQAYSIQQIQKEMDSLKSDISPESRARFNQLKERQDALVRGYEVTYYKIEANEKIIKDLIVRDAEEKYKAALRDRDRLKELEIKRIGSDGTIAATNKRGGLSEKEYEEWTSLNNKDIGGNIKNAQENLYNVNGGIISSTKINGRNRLQFRSKEDQKKWIEEVKKKGQLRRISPEGIKTDALNLPISRDDAL